MTRIENEGDVVIAAEKITTEAITFMARYACGLICLSLTEEKAKALNLPLMVRDNTSKHNTAFTISIEAKKGVTTGISAHDRARTVQVAIDDNSTEDDLARPGHLSSYRQKGWCFAQSRTHRGIGRSCKACRVETCGGNLRGHERRRYYGEASASEVLPSNMVSK